MGENPERRLTRSWNRNADSWAEAVRDGRIESRRSATDQAVVDAVLDGGGSRVLDVGCGEGWLARRLSAEGRDVVGFDGSARLIERAKEMGGGSFLLLSYDAFGEDPGTLNREFDVAVCNFSLLGERIVELLAALHRVVGPEGRLVIQTIHPATVKDLPSEAGWREERFDPLRPLEFSAMPWYFRTLDCWERELEESGWKLVRIREPVNPGTGGPASLILTAERRYERAGANAPLEEVT